MAIFHADGNMQRWSVVVVASFHSLVKLCFSSPIDEDIFLPFKADLYVFFFPNSVFHVQIQETYTWPRPSLFIPRLFRHVTCSWRSILANHKRKSIPLAVDHDDIQFLLQSGVHEVEWQWVSAWMKYLIYRLIYLDNGNVHCCIILRIIKGNQAPIHCCMATEDTRTSTSLLRRYQLRRTIARG